MVLRERRHFLRWKRDASFFDDSLPLRVIQYPILLLTSKCFLFWGVTSLVKGGREGPVSFFVIIIFGRQSFGAIITTTTRSFNTNERGGGSVFSSYGGNVNILTNLQTFQKVVQTTKRCRVDLFSTLSLSLSLFLSLLCVCVCVCVCEQY